MKMKEKQISLKVITYKSNQIIKFKLSFDVNYFKCFLFKYRN